MHFLLSLILSVVVVVIAILSVQNATVVSVKLLAWQLVPMPVGVVLALAFAGGILLVALAPLWQQLPSTSRATVSPPPHTREAPPSDWES